MKTTFCLWCILFGMSGSMMAQQRPQSSEKTKLNEGEFLIQGKMGGTSEGMIYLSEKTEGGYYDLDSTEVKNGKFSFRGEAPGMASLVFFRNHEKRSELSFFLESGLIKANLPGMNFSYGGQISGTVNNAILLKFKKDLQYVMDSIIMEAGIEASLNPDSSFNKESILRRSNLIASRSVEVTRQTILRFSSYPVAAYLIERHLAPNTTPQEVERAVDELAPALTHHPLVMKIRAKLRSQLLKAGDQAFEFPQTNTGERPVRLSDYRGKYLLLDFWASWCGPCMKEMPEIVKLYKDCKGKKFDILGISLDQKETDCKAAQKKMGMKWQQIYDGKVWNNKLAGLYNVKTIPYTVLIGPEGKIVALGLRGQELVTKVKELVKP